MYKEDRVLILKDFEDIRLEDFMIRYGINVRIEIALLMLLLGLGIIWTKIVRFKC